MSNPSASIHVKPERTYLLHCNIWGEFVIGEDYDGDPVALGDEWIEINPERARLMIDWLKAKLGEAND